VFGTRCLSIDQANTTFALSDSNLKGIISNRPRRHVKNFDALALGGVSDFGFHAAEMTARTDGVSPEVGTAGGLPESGQRLTTRAE
jgi:hypothetical protein